MGADTYVDGVRMEGASGQAGILMFDHEMVRLGESLPVPRNLGLLPSNNESNKSRIPEIPERSIHGTIGCRVPSGYQLCTSHPIEEVCTPWGYARKGPMPKGRKPGQEWEESKNGDREGSIQSRACMVDERGEGKDL